MSNFTVNGQSEHTYDTLNATYLLSAEFSDNKDLGSFTLHISPVEDTLSAGGRFSPPLITIDTTFGVGGVANSMRKSLPITHKQAATGVYEFYITYDDAVGNKGVPSGKVKAHITNLAPMLQLRGVQSDSVSYSLADTVRIGVRASDTDADMSRVTVTLFRRVLSPNNPDPRKRDERQEVNKYNVPVLQPSFLSHEFVYTPTAESAENYLLHIEAADAGSRSNVIELKIRILN